MPRGLSTAVKVALATDSFRLATLIDLNFPTVKRLTDFGQDITYNSNTYTASDHLLSIEDTSETAGLRVNSFGLTLSGVEQTYIDLVLAGDHINTRVDINRAIVTITNNVASVTGIIPFFSGYVSGFEIGDTSSSSELTLEIASHWKDFEKINCRRTNPTSQHRYFPNDTGFDFSHQSITDMKWGRA
jgi:hypothetical protein